MSNKIYYTYEDGMLGDSHGNSLKENGVSCADGVFIELPDEQKTKLDKIGDVFISLDGGPVDTVGKTQEVFSVLAQIAARAVNEPYNDAEIVSSVDIGELSSPLKNLCDHAKDDDRTPD
jgi:hypothetical protein